MASVEKEKRENGIEVWTLNRPDKRNSLSIELLQEFNRRLREIDEQTRVIVLTGAGEVFCAGLDLSLLSNLTPAVCEAYMDAASGMYLGLIGCAVPTIAAIKGAAIAGGFDLSVMCDIRISTPTAKFGQPEVRLALSGLTDPLWRIVGLGRAKELIYTGKIYDGQEAYRIGLVNQLADDPLAAALAMAAVIAANDPDAVRTEKHLTGQWPMADARAAVEDQLNTFSTFLLRPQTKARIAAHLATLGKKP